MLITPDEPANALTQRFYRAGTRRNNQALWLGGHCKRAFYSVDMPGLTWRQVRGIPSGWAAILDGLRFDRPQGWHPPALPDEEWKSALGFADRSRLTLAFGHACSGSIPNWAAERMANDRERNSQRTANLLGEYQRIAEALASRGVEHVLLKGFSHERDYVALPAARVQYDLDLWIPAGRPPRDEGHEDRRAESPAELLRKATEVLAGLGFDQVASGKAARMDHLPPYVRKTGWRWRGDFFDPDMPAIVELHYRLWDEETERIRVDGLDEFWRRRMIEECRGVSIPALDQGDRVSYAALHALRHLLRGDLTACHVYELSHFLHRRRNDQVLWERWHVLYTASFRQLQCISFGVAAAWFGNSLPPAIRTEMGRFPHEIHTWIERYAASPVVSQLRAAKDELWLHLALLGNAADRRAVLRRRLLPERLPGPVEGVFVPEAAKDLKIRVMSAAKYWQHAARRLGFHAVSLLRLTMGWITWRRRLQRTRTTRRATRRQRWPRP